MTWLAVKILLGGWLKRLSGALGALLKWIGRHPWQAAVIALCALSAGLWWHYSGKVETLTATVATRDRTIKDMKAASEQNRKDQLAQKAKAEQHYKDIAHEADKEHAEQLADANDALARYIATHRVRGSVPSGSISPAGSAPEGGNTTTAQGLPEGAVLVSADDLRICTANTAYALSAHNWAMSLLGTD